MNKLDELAGNADRAIDFMSTVVVVPLDIAKKIVAQLEVALNEIAEHDHCDYSSTEIGEYGRGVTDGHRCAAKIARKALKAEG